MFRWRVHLFESLPVFVYIVHKLHSIHSNIPELLFCSLHCCFHYGTAPHTNQCECVILFHPNNPSCCPFSKPLQCTLLYIKHKEYYCCTWLQITIDYSWPLDVNCQISVWILVYFCIHHQACIERKETQFMSVHELKSKSNKCISSTVKWLLFSGNTQMNTSLISFLLPLQARNPASHWRWSESSLQTRWGLRLSLPRLRLCPAAPRFTWVLHPLNMLLQVLVRKKVCSLRVILKKFSIKSLSLGPDHTSSCHKEDHLTAWDIYCMCMHLLTDQSHTCCAVCGLFNTTMSLITDSVSMINTPYHILVPTNHSKILYTF